MRQLIIFILLVSTLHSCTKDFNSDEFSTIDIDIVKDNFEDSQYLINNINITTSNDNILDNGYAKIMDENVVIIEGPWRSIINQTFSLSESKKYYLTISLSESKDGISKVSSQILIDNINYPKFIQIESIVMSQNVLEDSPYEESVSNSHITLVRIQNSSDFYNNSSELTDDQTILYLHSTFSPKTTDFTFTNTQIPVKTFNYNQFKNYELYVGYPLVVGTTVTDLRRIYFRLKIEELYLENNGQPDTTFTYISEDSDYGGIYSGTLKYKWIYD